MKRGVRRTIIFFCALGLFGNAFAQKENAHQALFKISEKRAESYVAGNMRLDKATGVPRAIYQANYAVAKNDPVEMAKQYLRENAAVLGIKPDLSDLTHHATRETRGGHHVRFNQTFGGYQVYQGEITVTINRDNVVTFVANGYRQDINLEIKPPAVSREAAIQYAKDYLKVRGKINLEKAEPQVYADGDESRLALKVTVVPAESPTGDWEVLVDGTTGEVFRAEDKAFYYRGDRLNKTAATGTGNTFDPDPITRSGSTYGTGGFTDNNDADSGDLTANTVSKTLLDITFSGGLHQLKGPFAEVQDFESPFKGLFSQASNTFNFTRNADAFEAVNVYFHIDQSMRYINQTLGVPLMPFQYSTGVQVDPHGLNGQDNAHYISSTGRLAFGEGGVDDAEDLEVVLHELGHGIHDWATNGQISQQQGLSEGCGDYWAASYTRSLGFWQSSDPEFNWVFRWDGHNQFWAGRIVNYAALYPGGLTGAIHTDGQMWSSTLMSIWNDIGRTPTDENFLECLSMLNSGSDQNDAANAFYLADAALHGGANQPAILSRFQQRGYTIGAGCTNIALNRPTLASSTNGNNVSSRAVDGNANTFWRSASGGTQYLRVDLGAGNSYGQVTIEWRGARYARSFTIRVSNVANFNTSTTVFTTTTGTGGTQTVNLSGAPRTERYILLHMTVANSNSYSVNEFEVCSSTANFTAKEDAGEGEMMAATIPEEVTLRPNYPNPFNPSTQISFAVPEARHVTLKIYNLAGQEVATLVNEMRERGNYTVTFDAARLTSGVYFSVLQAGDVRQVRRLVLMK